MRTNPNFWSDEFNIVDDPNSTDIFEDDLEDYCIDDALLNSEDRRLAMWQQIERHVGEQRLRLDPAEWDYWDEYLTVH